jgi:Fe2+ transport system protein FeoA
MDLSNLVPGQEAVIVAVADGPSHEGRRLGDIGFVPGTRIAVERRAPLGDPTVYVVRGVRIALRRVSAALIEVREPSDDPAGEMAGGTEG